MSLGYNGVDDGVMVNVVEHDCVDIRWNVWRSDL